MAVVNVGGGASGGGGAAGPTAIDVAGTIGFTTMTPGPYVDGS
jgi:hypothetical protein